MPLDCEATASYAVALRGARSCNASEAKPLSETPAIAEPCAGQRRGGRRARGAKNHRVMNSRPHCVAVVQRPSVFYEREETLRRAVSSVDEAVAGGAHLIVFPETYVPGYPDWVWRIAPDRYDLHRPIFARLLENAVDLSGGGLQPLQEAARRHGVTVVCGIDELNSEFSRTTMYNTLVTIGTDGVILNRHRKLMPTNPERMIWGIGDGSGLRVVDTPSGRVVA